MRPPYRGDATRDHSGPSDEFLAIDAGADERSFGVLYDRYADPLYRFFLGASGDAATAGRLMDDMIAGLPEALHGFVAGERTFPGWLYSLASRHLERNQFSVFRRVRRVGGALSRLSGRRHGAGELTGDADLDRALQALRTLPVIERQVILLSSVIGLSATQVADAIGLPTMAVSTRLATGSASLGEHLGMQSGGEARSYVSTAIAGVALSDRQRERHRRLTRPAFGTEDVQEESAGSLARQLAVVALVAVIGLAGLVGWDYAATRLAEGPEDGDVATENGNSAAETASEDGIGASSDVAAVDEDVQPCPADERLALLDEFVGHFNDGEMDEVGAMLPESADSWPPATSLVREDATALQSIVPFDPAEFDPDSVLEQLQSRHDAGERWVIADAVAGEDYPEWFGASPIEPYLNWVEDEPRLELVMVNDMVTRRESQMLPRRGPVVVDCTGEQVVAWGLETQIARGNEPVDFLDFVFNTTSLNPGEERIWQVRAVTADRADNGGLRQWDLEWRQAVDTNGTLMQRGTVYTTGGEEVVTFSHDGERWRLDQRGWTRFGTDEDVPLPEEITQVVPWLNRSAGVAHLNSDEIAPQATQRIVSDPIDLSRSGGMHAEVYDSPEADRMFTLELADGAVTGAVLREVRDGGQEFPRPEISIINLDRVQEFAPSDYQFMFYPRYLDRDTRVPRYQLPDDEVEELALDDSSYADDGTREEYRLRWNDVALQLTVTPSRGGIEFNDLVTEYDDFWRSDSESYVFGVFQWSENGINGAPALALWDNGRFRFELQLEDVNPSGEDWNLSELAVLADELATAGP